MTIHDKNRPERLPRHPVVRGYGAEPTPRNGFGAFLLTLAIIGPFNDRQMDRAIRTYRSTRAVTRH